MKRFQSSLIVASYLVLVVVGCTKKEAELPLTEKLSPRAEFNSEPTGDHVSRTNNDSLQTEQATDISRVQADVRKDLRAMFSGDVDTALAYLYPKLIELLGGSAKVRNSLQKQLAEFQNSQITMESLTFPEAPTFLKSATHQFAIVPTKYILTMKGMRMENMSYLIAVRDIGSVGWTFVDTSANDIQRIRKVLPDFPEDYKIPRSSRRRL